MGQRAFTRRQRLEVAQILFGSALGHLAELDRGAGATHAALAILDRGLRLLRDTHGATPNGDAGLAQLRVLMALENGDQSAGAEAVLEWEAACWPAAPPVGAAGRERATKRSRPALAS